MTRLSYKTLRTHGNKFRQYVFKNYKIGGKDYNNFDKLFYLVASGMSDDYGYTDLVFYHLPKCKLGQDIDKYSDIDYKKIYVSIYHVDNQGNLQLWRDTIEDEIIIGYRSGVTSTASGFSLYKCPEFWGELEGNDELIDREENNYRQGGTSLHDYVLVHFKLNDIYKILIRQIGDDPQFFLTESVVQYPMIEDYPSNYSKNDFFTTLCADHREIIKRGAPMTRGLIETGHPCPPHWDTGIDSFVENYLYKTGGIKKSP